jgi:hypothetical protein
MLIKAKSAVWGSMDKSKKSGKKATTTTSSGKKTMIRASSMALLGVDKTPPLSAAEISAQVGYGAQSQRPHKGVFFCCVACSCARLNKCI